MLVLTLNSGPDSRSNPGEAQRYSLPEKQPVIFARISVPFPGRMEASRSSLSSLNAAGKVNFQSSHFLGSVFAEDASLPPPLGTEWNSKVASSACGQNSRDTSDRLPSLPQSHCST